MLTYGPYTKFYCFMVHDAVIKALVPEQWVQVHYRDADGHLLKSDPEKYEDFVENLQLADRLQEIADEVAKFIRIEHHLSTIRVAQGRGASPILPNVLLDIALKKGEITLDELDVQNKQQADHIALKKREAKAAAKTMMKGQDNSKK